MRESQSSPTWWFTLHYCCLWEFTLAGNLSQEPEPGLKLWCALGHLNCYAKCLLLAASLLITPPLSASWLHFVVQDGGCNPGPTVTASQLERRVAETCKAPLRRLYRRVTKCVHLGSIGHHFVTDRKGPLCGGQSCARWRAGASITGQAGNSDGEGVN